MIYIIFQFLFDHRILNFSYFFKRTAVLNATKAVTLNKSLKFL